MEIEVKHHKFTTHHERNEVSITSEQIFDLLKPYLPEGIPDTAQILVKGCEEGIYTLGRDGLPTKTGPVEFKGLTIKWELYNYESNGQKV